MKQRLLPRDFEGILFTQYHQCCQGNKNVGEYAKEFHRLSSRINLNETEEQLVARFVQGLKAKFQEKLILQPQYSLMDTIRVVDQLEKRDDKFTSGPSTSKFQQNSDKGILPSPEERKVNTESTQDVRVHRAADQRNSNIKCYRCNEWGHKSNTCPKRAQVYIADDKGKRPMEPVEEESDDQFDDEAHLDEGNEMSCIVHRTCHVPHTDIETQRSNLFRTRGTIMNKVCDIIIDNGSTDNLISWKAVNKL